MKATVESYGVLTRNASRYGWRVYTANNALMRCPSQKAVVDKGLARLLNEAREENPLEEALPPSESSRP